MNIINFSQEIKSLNDENNDKIIIIQNKKGENIDITNQINEEKNVNNVLINDLKIKEKNILENQQKLDEIHKKINLYENDINNLKNAIDKNYD